MDSPLTCAAPMAHRQAEPSLDPVILKRRWVNQADRYWWAWPILTLATPLLLLLFMLVGVWPGGSTEDPEAWRRALELLWERLRKPELRDFWLHTVAMTALSAVGLWAVVTILPRQRLVITADTLSWRLPLPAWSPIKQAGWTIKLTDIVAAKLVKPPFASGGAMTHLELTVKRMPRQLQPAMWVAEDHQERMRPGLLSAWKLMRTAMTTAELLQTPLCTALTARGVHIDDLPLARSARGTGFALESNPATLGVTGAVLACLFYTPIDLLVYSEQYATTPPFALMAICGLVACAAGAAYLANSDAPRAVSIGLAVMLGLTAAAASAPAMLRVNALTDDVGIQPVTYYRTEINRFAPVSDTGWPEIELPQPSYWLLQEEGTQRQIHIRRGGLGLYQMNLDNINAELRSYFQGRRNGD